MPYWSKVWGVEVRDEIAQEFLCRDGQVDDMLAGLHEIRRRLEEGRQTDAPAAGDSGPFHRPA